VSDLRLSCFELGGNVRNAKENPAFTVGCFSERGGLSSLSAFRVDELQCQFLTALCEVQMKTCVELMSVCLSVTKSLRIFAKFGIGVLYKMLSKNQSYENRLIGGHAVQTA
jgi:hypothetical protein